VSRYQKGKTNLNFTEARDSEWHWHQLGHMQVCTSIQTVDHASIPPLSFFTGRMPVSTGYRAVVSTDNAQKCSGSSSSFTNVHERENRAFTKLKRKGIDKYNRCHAGLEDGEVLRERQMSFPCTVVACGKCSGVFSKAYLWRHKRVCCSTQACVAKAIDVKII